MQLTSTAAPIRAGEAARLDVQLERGEPEGDYAFFVHHSTDPLPAVPVDTIAMTRRSNQWLDIDFDREGTWHIHVEPDPLIRGNATLITIQVFPAAGTPQIALAKGAVGPDNGDVALWTAIRSVSGGLAFADFEQYALAQISSGQGPGWYGTDAYDQLRAAADDFLARAVAVAPADAAAAVRSYVAQRRLRFLNDPDAADLDATGALPPVGGSRAAMVHQVGAALPLPLTQFPFVELIHEYWLEEGMVVQSLHHILARFQNRRTRGGEALGRFDLNPLLPLRNLLWGFAEGERRRLTVRRRAAEYEYQYGLRLIGRAVPRASTVVERRSQFLEAFHALLNAAHGFFKERDDKTVDADAFPLLGSLREVHLVLAQGAHNQFADLPITSRAEMLSMQWILARSEMNLFLGGRPMVPYQEPWMDRVDSMKSLFGWADASITHFFHLATFGEQILLSIRHGQWNDSGRLPGDAAVWADTWRSEIQQYIHAYRAVTGVDLSAGVDVTMPSTLLARRLGRQLRRA